MKIDCTVNCGYQNTDFINAAYKFALENNCVIESDDKKTVISGFMPKSEVARLMLILDTFKLYAKVKMTVH